MAQHSKALKVSLIAALLIIGLAATPVQANHSHDLLVPLAGFFILGSLLRHNHGHGHGNANHGYGYGYSKRHYSQNGHSGHQHNRRARSYSHEGYKRRSKRNHSR